MVENGHNSENAVNVPVIQAGIKVQMVWQVSSMLCVCMMCVYSVVGGGHGGRLRN